MNNKNNGYIFTLYGNFNYGNKLQNYATQLYFNKYGIDAKTVIFNSPYSLKKRIKSRFKHILNLRKSIYRKEKAIYKKRENNFKKFDNKINKIKINKINLNNAYYYIIGSDQVYNSNDIQSHQIVDYINSINKDNKKIFGFSASIGIKDIIDKYKEKYKIHFNKLDMISVREEQAKTAIENLTGRTDVEVLLDPTMLIDRKIWKDIVHKPEIFNKVFSDNEKYIFNYFLGSCDKENMKKIEDFAKKNNCKIINVLDKHDPFYLCGPDEFLWLEQNAFCVFTDSFHSSVFSIIFGTPFMVFERIDSRKNNMSTRIINLLNKFDLNDRLFSRCIKPSILDCDYSNVYKKIDEERKKAEKFIKKIK